MRLFFYTLCLIALLMLGGDIALAQSDNVVLLEESIFESAGSGAAAQRDFGTYVSTIFNLTIGLAAMLAVVQITVGGIERMSSESIQKQSDGKKRIRDAVFGLVLALTAWLILNTINPNLLRFDLASMIDEAIGEADPNFEGASGSPGSGDNSQCFDCSSMRLSSTYIKPGICGGNSANCVISETINDSLVGLSEEGDVPPWRVTEANPNDAQHRCTCHARGTCVDVGLTGGGSQYTAENINRFIAGAQQNGMDAIFEVQTDAERDQLIADGVNPGNIKTISGISAKHFSVYSRGCHG